MIHDDDDAWGGIIWKHVVFNGRISNMMHQGERETMGDDEWRDEDVNSLAWNNADKAGRLW